MTRDIVIYGESLLLVKGNVNSAFPLISELGLAEREITISPTFYHADVLVDDFGPHCPVEVQCLLQEISITAALVDYDASLLEYCLAESLGRNSISGGVLQEALWGQFNGAGSLLGNYQPMFASGNHFFEVDINTAQGLPDWRLKSCFLSQRPVVIPLGTKRTRAEINIRCIPYCIPLVPLLSGFNTATVPGPNGPVNFQIPLVNYSGEIMSSGVVLFDHTLTLI